MHRVRHRRTIRSLLRELLQMMEIVMTNQEELDARAARLEASNAGLRLDVQGLKQAVQDLKDAAAEGAPLDFSAIDAELAKSEALDAETPAPETPEG
jgi:hypothetical protein